MGVLTLQNYLDDLDSALQRSGISSTLKTRWTNQALKEFGYAFRFHELEGTKTFITVDGQNSYTIGAGLNIDVTDFRFVEELRKTAPNTRLGRILPETRSQYLKKIGDTASTTAKGNPEHYHKFGNKLMFRPIPDAALVTVDMDYYKTLTSFVAVSDVSPLHEDWDEVIFVGALYRGFRHFGEFDRYQNVRNDFLGLVRSRQTEYELEEFPEGGISPLAPGDTEASLESE